MGVVFCVSPVLKSSSFILLEWMRESGARDELFYQDFFWPNFFFYEPVMSTWMQTYFMFRLRAKHSITWGKIRRGRSCPPCSFLFQPEINSRGSHIIGLTVYVRQALWTQFHRMMWYVETEWPRINNFIRLISNLESIFCHLPSPPFWYSYEFVFPQNLSGIISCSKLPSIFLLPRWSLWQYRHLWKPPTF